jgi:hypothetical protein
MRGSKPGERRGGRQKGTPNKKTAYVRAVMAAHAANENVSPLDVMLAVMRDPHVALATRVKMALKALPRLHAKATPRPAGASWHGEEKPRQGGNNKGGKAGTNPAPESTLDANVGRRDQNLSASQSLNGNQNLMPLDFLLAVIKDAKTPAALQMKAATATLPYTHPKQSNRAKHPTIVPDRFGFAVDPALAKKLRNKVARLAQLRRRRNLPPAKRKAIRRLGHETDTLIAALQCADPFLYNDKHATEDRERLEWLWRKRRSRAKLSPIEDAAHAHIHARHTAYITGPEPRARVRLESLRQRHRLHRMANHPALSPWERGEMKYLATLYPRQLHKFDPDFLERESLFSMAVFDEDGYPCECRRALASPLHDLAMHQASGEFNDNPSRLDGGPLQDAGPVPDSGPLADDRPLQDSAPSQCNEHVHPEDPV